MQMYCNYFKQKWNIYYVILSSEWPWHVVWLRHCYLVIASHEKCLHGHVQNCISIVFTSDEPISHMTSMSLLLLFYCQINTSWMDSLWPQMVYTALYNSWPSFDINIVQYFSKSKEYQISNVITFYTVISIKYVVWSLLNIFHWFCSLIVTCLSIKMRKCLTRKLTTYTA